MTALTYLILRLTDAPDARGDRFFAGVELGKHAAERMSSSACFPNSSVGRRADAPRTVIGPGRTASVLSQTGERHQGAESARERRPSDLIRFAPA